MIYLDNAASTPLLPSVKDKLISCLNIYGNPSSIHEEGQKAKQLVNESRDIISRKLHCNRDNIYFTTGATMSNNIVLQKFDGIKYVSTIEHEDIQMIADAYDIQRINVDTDGFLDLRQLELIVSHATKPTLFSVQCANSEIGTVQDIKRISEIIHSNKNCYFHTDATQFLPYYNIDVNEFGIDALSMSGQKIGCIKGIGILYLSDTIQQFMYPFIYGKQGYIGGTENVLGIACLGEAFNQLDYNNEEMIRLRDKLIQGINGELIGNIEYRLPNNVCVCYEGLDAQSIVLMLNEHGICCSAGSACSSGDAEPSSTLRAIRLPKEKINSCVRFTLSKNTTEEEIDESIEVINNVTSFLMELKG